MGLRPTPDERRLVGGDHDPHARGF
jgi:hypothetical protein